MISFNINHNVHVKLTDAGKTELKRQHDSMYGSMPNHLWSSKYEPPVEDADGWSKWQLWDLMSQLGGKCYNGCNVPFETEIKIDV